MKYPKSKKSAKLYAAYLADLRKKEFFPIERVKKIKNKYALNFAAAESGEELTDFLCNGWAIVK